MKSVRINREKRKLASNESGEYDAPSEKKEKRPGQSRVKKGDRKSRRPLIGHDVNANEVRRKGAGKDSKEGIEGVKREKIIGKEARTRGEDRPFTASSGRGIADQRPIDQSGLESKQNVTREGQEAG